MAKLSPINLRFIGIPTFRHFNSMVPTFKMTEKDRSNHWALWRTPKTRLVTWFIYDHQRKLLTPGKIGLKIWLTIVLYLTKPHDNDTDNWRNYWGDNTHQIDSKMTLTLRDIQLTISHLWKQMLAEGLITRVNICHSYALCLWSW